MWIKYTLRILHIPFLFIFIFVYFPLFIYIYLFRCSSRSSSSSEEEDYTIYSTKCQFMQNRRYKLQSKIAVLSFLCLMNSFVLEKSMESKNTNVTYISISICLINTAIGSILVGNIWKKYYGLSIICYFVCELALATYICFILFFLQSLWKTKIQI